VYKEPQGHGAVSLAPSAAIRFRRGKANWGQKLEKRLNIGIDINIFNGLFLQFFIGQTFKFPVPVLPQGIERRRINVPVDVHGGFEKILAGGFVQVNVVTHRVSVYIKRSGKKE
jgi:hypothetical protein